MAVLKRLAARTQPWRTPEEMENTSEIVRFTLTTLWVDEYRVLMISTSFGGMPIVLRMSQRALRSRESNAALRSMYAAYVRYIYCMWAKTLAGSDRSDIPRYLMQSDF